MSGNPVRPEFFSRVQRNAIGDVNDARSSDVEVLVFGGSQGAHAINVAMVEAAPALAALGVPLRVTHQTGERDVEMVRAGYAAPDSRPRSSRSSTTWDGGLAQADLVVCRAGATTLAELAAAGKPSILIPLPTATDDHQRRNAEALAAAGAADVLLQADASGAALAGGSLRWRRTRARASAWAPRRRSLARPDAAKVIVDRALALARRGDERGDDVETAC